MFHVYQFLFHVYKKYVVQGQHIQRKKYVNTDDYDGMIKINKIAHIYKYGHSIRN